MSQKPSFKQKVSYMFDNIMAAGTPAMIGMLALLSLVVVFVAAAIISLFSINQPGEEGALSFGEAAWMSLMRTLDAGTMGGDAGFGFRLVMLLVTVGGIFVVSSLIGVLSAGVESKLEELRKGRSIVLENNHTIILGWSPQVFTIISELVEANSNQKRAAIAILAENDKVEMEDEIRARIDELKTTRVICRSGNPMDPTDLELVSPHTARSIIVIPPDSEDPDTFVIKTVLAITNNPNRREEPYHIITQLRDEKSQALVKMISTRDDVNAVMMGELIARVTAQTSRLSGLSVVYTELMNFGGDEIYFKEEPSLSGRTFGDALLAFEDSTVMGIGRANGAVLLNPPMDTRFEPGDKVIAISADDDTVKLSGLNTHPIQTAALRTNGHAAPPKPEKSLLLGWNLRAGIILKELDAYVAKGSVVTVVADDELEKDVKACAKLTDNQKVTFMAGDTTDRELLDSLKIEDFDHVIVVADTTRSVQESDARTLVTLLHLRDIASRDETPFSIVSEMLDLRNRELAEVTKVDDFIVSDHLISLMTAQLSENSALMGVFTDLFDPEGSEVYLKPIEQYVATGEPVNFYTVVEAARRRGETAIGYRIEAQHSDAKKSYGVYTNPKKSSVATFTAEDKIIVLAES
ncbi:MAG: potassium transporter TrkA [Chloroflexi bacterium HGW-Chloroflexi-6]|nr:MAG: potassium transporter TrkA [Chloroflexi bacterium HGW-Chloroflexi-6]